MIRLLRIDGLILCILIFSGGASADEPIPEHVEWYRGAVGKIESASGKFVGTGFVAGESGLVLVASHTVSDDTMAFCPADSKYCAQMVELLEIPKSDISVFELIGKLPVDTLPLGLFDELRLGQQVRVLGWHFEKRTILIQDAVIVRRGHSLLEGDTVEYIEVSASQVIPGCSGGPVLNSNNEVVAILSEGFISENLNSGERVRIARCYSIEPLRQLDESMSTRNSAE